MGARVGLSFVLVLRGVGWLGRGWPGPCVVWVGFGLRVSVLRGGGCRGVSHVALSGVVICFASLTSDSPGKSQCLIAGPLLSWLRWASNFFGIY